MLLETILDFLGLSIADIPPTNTDMVNLYSNLGDPIATLIKSEKGDYKLRFSNDIISNKIEPLPSGGLRTFPKSLI